MKGNEAKWGQWGHTLGSADPSCGPHCTPILVKFKNHTQKHFGPLGPMCVLSGWHIYISQGLKDPQLTYQRYPGDACTYIHTWRMDQVPTKATPDAPPPLTFLHADKHTLEIFTPSSFRQFDPINNVESTWIHWAHIQPPYIEDTPLTSEG